MTPEEILQFYHTNVSAEIAAHRPLLDNEVQTLVEYSQRHQHFSVWFSVICKYTMPLLGWQALTNASRPIGFWTYQQASEMITTYPDLEVITVFRVNSPHTLYTILVDRKEAGLRIEIYAVSVLAGFRLVIQASSPSESPHFGATYDTLDALLTGSGFIQPDENTIRLFTREYFHDMFVSTYPYVRSCHVASASNDQMQLLLSMEGLVVDGDDDMNEVIQGSDNNEVRQVQEVNTTFLFEVYKQVFGERRRLSSKLKHALDGICLLAEQEITRMGNQSFLEWFMDALELCKRVEAEVGAGHFPYHFTLNPKLFILGRSIPDRRMPLHRSWVRVSDFDSTLLNVITKLDNGFVRDWWVRATEQGFYRLDQPDQVVPSFSQLF